MTKKTFIQKENGNTLDANEWNELTSYVNTAVDAINAIPTDGTPSTIDTDGVISVNSKGNVTIGSNNIKNVNIEPGYPYSGDSTKYGDIALKPGDDIQYASHHREPKKRDKIVVKNIDGEDNPVKLNVVAGEIELAVGTTKNPKTATRKKDKTTGADTAEAMFKPTDAKTLDVKILTGNVLDEGGNNERDERAYLKVRAQAIDLRCEKHGGIALQPKGYDSDGNMNKIKFEHGGGDGLEFGTFNTEKTSIFTDEYRFNREGIWKMSNRTTEPSGKAIIDEIEGYLGPLTATGALKYKKNTAANNSDLATQTGKTYESPDDFYDFIDTSDEQCRTKDIIKTAYAFNGQTGVHSHISSKGNLEIESFTAFVCVDSIPSEATSYTYDGGSVNRTSEDPYFTIVDGSSFKVGKAYTDAEINASFQYGLLDANGKTLLDILTEAGAEEYISIDYNNSSSEPTQMLNVSFKKNACPNINIESGANVKLSADGAIKLGELSIQNDNVDFGEMDNGITFNHKLTKKNADKDCGIIKLVAENNSTTSTFTIHTADSSDGTLKDYVIPQKQSIVTQTSYTPQTITSCSIEDIIMFVNWAKGSGYGPWSVEAISGKKNYAWGAGHFEEVSQSSQAPGEINHGGHDEVTP